MPREPYEKIVSTEKIAVFKTCRFYSETLLLVSEMVLLLLSLSLWLLIQLYSKIWCKVNGNFPVHSNGVLYQHLIDLLALFLKQLHIYIIRYT